MAEEMSGGKLGGFQLGALQMVMGLKNRKKADAALPSLNAGESQLLNTVRRRRRALETGTAGFLDKKLVGQNVKQYGQNAFRAGGPVNTGVLAQLMNQGMKNISDQYAQEYGQTLAQEGKVTKDISDFFNDIQGLKSARFSSRGEQQIQAGQQNMFASLPSKDDIMKILKMVGTGGAGGAV